VSLSDNLIVCATYLLTCSPWSWCKQVTTRSGRKLCRN